MPVVEDSFLGTGNTWYLVLSELSTVIALYCVSIHSQSFLSTTVFRLPRHVRQLVADCSAGYLVQLHPIPATDVKVDPCVILAPSSLP